jgi:hypothetical protein
MRPEALVSSCDMSGDRSAGRHDMVQYSFPSRLLILHAISSVQPFDALVLQLHDFFSNIKDGMCALYTLRECAIHPMSVLALTWHAEEAHHTILHNG